MSRTIAAVLTAAAATAALALGGTARAATPAPIAVAAAVNGTAVTAATPVTLTGASEVTFTAAGGDGQPLTWSPLPGSAAVVLTGSGAAETATFPAPAASEVIAVQVTDGKDAADAVVTLSLPAGTATLAVTQVTPASAPVLSKGHAVATANTREEVLFTASKPGWVYFTIVGPGPINGHQGWVDAKAGLNDGYYSGLEYGHGYAVYFTVVAARGSTVPLPGAKTGHVYFVAGK